MINLKILIIVLSDIIILYLCYPKHYLIFLPHDIKYNKKQYLLQRVTKLNIYDFYIVIICNDYKDYSIKELVFIK